MTIQEFKSRLQENPNEDDDQDIRNFIQTSFDGLSFETFPLVKK